MKKPFNKSTLINFWHSFYDSYLPTGRDNIIQIVVKVAFLLSIVLLILFFIFVSSYFLIQSQEQNLFLENRQAFQQLSAGNNQNCEKALKYFKKQNPDLKAWISIDKTSIASPVYQTANNEFYLTHNQLREESSYGTLCFDSKDSVIADTIDQNFVIYGNSPKTDHLFSSLKNYKSIYYYRKNPYITLSTFQGTDKYVIFAAFVINSNRADDDNYIFDYKRSAFYDDGTFALWLDELTQRSLYSSGIPVTAEDHLLTLETDSVEFEGAKLVVMARKLHENEEIDFSKAKVNKKPRYPSIYYNLMGIDNPYGI